MPTRRWMYIAPVSFAFVFFELWVMFGRHWQIIIGAPQATEDLTGKFYVFVALMVGQAALWGYLGCLILEWLVQSLSDCRSGPSLKVIPAHYWAAVATRFLSTLAAVAVWHSFVNQLRPGWNLAAYEEVNIHNAGVLGFVPAVMGVSAMWAVEVAVYSSRPANGEVGGAQLDCYLNLRERLGNILAATAIILTLGTLSINVSRDFLKTADAKNWFPHDLVILFGGVFTVLLGMAYAPAYLALREMGCHIRDSMVPDAPPQQVVETHDSDSGFRSVTKWAASRKKLGRVLELQIRDWKSFGPQFAIVAPLATGLASRLLGGN